MAGFVALAAAFSLAPRPLPAVPPPVRLEGALDTTTIPKQNELVVVPAPSIDLGEGAAATTTTTVAPVGPPSPPMDETPTQVAGDGDSMVDDSSDGSADSIDDSADSPDD